MELALRLADPADEPAIERLIRASVIELLAEFHSRATLDAAMGTVFGLDRQLIADRTYFVVETGGRIVGCGGWSERNRPFGGDAAGGADAAALLDPATDSARIRAFFVTPKLARRGVGTRIMTACERAVAQAGFGAIQISATLAGERLYARFGYAVVDRGTVELEDGGTIAVVTMAKRLDHALESGRLSYRPLAPADVQSLLALATDDHIRRYLFDGELMSRAWCDAAVATSARSFADAGVGLWLVREADGTGPVGFCGFWVFDELGPELQLLYAVLERCTGRGYATEIATTLIEAGRRAGMTSLVSAVDAPNTASMRVLEKVGFERTGTVPGAFGETVMFMLQL